MPRTVVVLSGAVATGKTTLARRLEERFGARRIATRELLLSQTKKGERPDRATLQALGDTLDADTGGAWVADAVSGLARELSEEAMILVDSARIVGQIEALRAAFGRGVIHVHLTPPPAEVDVRYESRRSASSIAEPPSYADVRTNPTEANIDELANHADVVIDTSRSTEDDVFVRATSHLGLTSRETGQRVDVIIGGQYGSEGKGHLAYHIATAYDVLVRVGGPNAGHRVIWPDGTAYTHRSLPSGTLAGQARLLIGAGSVIDVATVLQEIAECQVDVDRLAIDPQAMIISGRDKTAEKRLVERIGSTGQGVGAATARRVSRGASVKLARDVKELRPYTQRAATELLEESYARRERILLEGTQGTALSLLHGHYPHVTSRDTSVSGCLAEAGIPPRQVRKVIMVCRTYPIRVMSPQGHTSGPMAQEVTWEEISARSRIPVDELKDAEKGSVSRKQRRVAEFNWSLLRRAATLNDPTDIALTFTDYLSIENRRARRFEQLTPETINFIEEVERVASAPVSLIGTEFHARSIIDRRTW